jgi:hypothetical protein
LKIHGLVILLTMVIVCLTGTTIMGQDFSQLLEAVDKVEANLAKQLDAEKSERTSQIAEIKTEMRKLHDLLKQRSSATAAPDGTSVAFEEMLKSSQETAAHHQALLSQLQEFDQKLMSLFEEQNIRLSDMEAKYASTEPGSEPVASKEMVAELRGMIDEIKISMSESEGEEDALSSLEISGFFDAVSSYQSSQDDKVDFAMNQAEIDIESAISERASAAMAVAYNGESGNFELAVAELGLNLYASEESAISTVDVGLGQFDIPFGIDFHEYASPDRKLITGPVAVDHTHEGWNDFGFYLSAESSPANFVAYLVNGFESSAEMLSLVLNEETNEEEEAVVEIETTPAYAFGTRIGFTQFSGFELGTSFALGMNESGKSEMLLWGADLQYALSDFEFKGEFVYHSRNRSVEEENNRGYYAQASYGGLGDFTLVGRYGSFKANGGDWAGQTSLGAGYSLFDGVEIRFEMLFDSDSENNLQLLQFVAGF